MKEKFFAELGFGNGTFFSTEIEVGEEEFRVPKFVVPLKKEQIYLRVWLFKRVFILSSKEFFKFQKKNKNKFKFLIGIVGYGRKGESVKLKK